MSWQKKAIEVAKQNLKKDGRLYPVVLVNLPKAQIIIDLSHMALTGQAARDFIKDQIDNPLAEEYLLLFEAWAYRPRKNVKNDPLAELLMGGSVGVSDLSSKEECVTVIHGKNGKERLGVIFFKRKGKAIQFEPIEWLSEGSLWQFMEPPLKRRFP